MSLWATDTVAFTAVEVFTEMRSVRSTSQPSSWFTAAENQEFRLDDVYRVDACELFCVFRCLTAVPWSTRKCPTSTKNQIRIQATFGSIFFGSRCSQLGPVFTLWIVLHSVSKPTKVTRSSLRVKMPVIYFIYAFFPPNLLWSWCFMNSR